MTTDFTIEGYRDLVRIGRGGLGDVYRATQVSTGATVAIKILRDVSDSSLAWHRTRRELSALVALGGHANVVQLLELLQLEQGPGLAMEYAPGGSVAGLFEDRGAPLSVDEAVFVGRQTASALVAAHERGIVHRDIKPQNLLIDAYGQIKLCDFGIAALTTDEEYRTRTNAVSMRYASPEDLEHDEEVGPPSDVYSLGATLRHLVHGTPLTLKDRLAPWTPPATDDPTRAELDHVIASCLQPTPAARPPARDLLDAFDRLTTSAGARRVTALPVVEQQPELDDAPRAPTPDIPSLAIASGSAVFIPEGPEADSDATTRYRPKKIGDPIERPAPPRPEPARRRSRRAPALLASVAALGALGAGAWLLTNPGDDDAELTASEPGLEPAPTTEPAAPASAPLTEPPNVPATTAPSGPLLADRPEALVDIADPSIVWSAGGFGDCLVQVPDSPELQVIDCSEPHDLQRFAEGELDAAAFPPDAPRDADAVKFAVNEACDAAFPSFVGSSVAETQLQRPTTIPSDATWATGDRAYRCYVGVAGKRLVGDARTSGW